jgi:hypothetical protein
MACSKNFKTSFQLLWSGGSTSTTVKHALVGPINASEAHKVRPSWELRGSSPAISLRAFYQYSDDLETWDSETEFGPAASSTEGWTYGTTFTDITAGTRKLYVRFGLAAKNASGTEIEVGRARLQLDFEGAG